MDLRSPLVHPTRLEGTAIGPSGQPLRTVMIGLANASAGTLYTSLGGISPREDGRFSVTSDTGAIPVLRSRHGERRPTGDPGLLPFWTSAEVTVNEQDFLDLTLHFLPGTSVSGKLEFVGSQAAPDLTRLRISLVAVRQIAGTADPPPAMSPQPDGSFVFGRATRQIPAVDDRRRVLVAAIGDGGRRDTLDQPLEVVTGQDVADVAVTLTDRPTALAGTLFDQLGRPTPGVHRRRLLHRSCALADRATARERRRQGGIRRPVHRDRPAARRVLPHGADRSRSVAAGGIRRFSSSSRPRRSGSRSGKARRRCRT